MKYCERFECGIVLFMYLSHPGHVHCTLYNVDTMQYYLRCWGRVVLHLIFSCFFSSYFFSVVVEQRFNVFGECVCVCVPMQLEEEKCAQVLTERGG